MEEDHALENPLPQIPYTFERAAQRKRIFRIT